MGRRVKLLLGKLNPPMRAIQISSEPVSESSINIIDTTGGQVITTIEFLSLANKLLGTGRARYLKKQVEAIEAGINLVKIDLLRASDWVLSVPESCLAEEVRGDYHVCVFHATRPDFREVYPISVGQPLPAIQTPLRPTDTDVPLAWQPLIDTAYEHGRYHPLIDYAQDPPR